MQKLQKKKQEHTGKEVMYRRRAGGTAGHSAGRRAFVQASACIGVSLLVWLVLMAGGPGKGTVDDGRLAREGYGGSEQSYQLFVEGLDKEAVPLQVEVSPRSYTDEEADELFYDLMDGMAERIRGENADLSQVRTRLELPGSLSESGVRLRWQSSEPEVLSADGRVFPPEEGSCPVTLSVQMSVGEHKALFELPVVVCALQRTEGEQRLLRLTREIRKRNEQNPQSEWIDLPQTFEGRDLRYTSTDRGSYQMLPVLGAALAVLLAARKKSQKKEQEKRREQELLLDYAELVSKLMVFIGAGLTIRGAWERMVQDYRAAKEQGRTGPRAAYEEMERTGLQLANGMPEGAAYREFGRRCRLHPYLKLSTLLEQNRKAGMKNLREIMRTEMVDAFELRKNLARRLGEEAGTKLLMPLFLTLGSVMVMIMAPAMMTMAGG